MQNVTSRASGKPVNVVAWSPSQGGPFQDSNACRSSCQCPALVTAAPAHCCYTVAEAVPVVPRGGGAGRSGGISRATTQAALFRVQCHWQSGSLGSVTPRPGRGHALALRLCSANVWGWAPRLLVPGPALEIRNWGFGVSASGLAPVIV